MAFTNSKDKKDHIMIVKGDIFNKENVVTRLHSSCLTGDVLGSLRCGCADQLHTSLSIIDKEGLGIFLYMQQEGRGIGLTNKIKAYILQETGLDTYDANVYLGFKPDEQQYEISAAMLDKGQVKSIRLLTNNLEKIKALKQYGVAITERLPIEIPANEHNRLYLLTKQNRLGHILHLDRPQSDF